MHKGYRQAKKRPNEKILTRSFFAEIGKSESQNILLLRKDKDFIDLLWSKRIP